MSRNFVFDANPKGWTAGGVSNWSLRVDDDLHSQFDRTIEDRSITGFVLPGRITTHVVADTSVDIVRVSVNYLFN
jgi:hypothetical protein